MTRKKIKKNKKNEETKDENIFSFKKTLIDAYSEITGSLPERKTIEIMEPSFFRLVKPLLDWFKIVDEKEEKSRK